VTGKAKGVPRAGCPVIDDIPEEVQSIYVRLRDKYQLGFEPLTVRGRRFRFLNVTDLSPFIEGKNPMLSPSEFPFWVKIWESAMVLADFLAHISSEPPKRVLELGAGLGVSGLVAASYGHEVTITDMEDEVLDFSRISAAVNGCKNVTFSRLDWLSPSDTLGQFDLIVGSEVLFSERFFQPLLKVFELYLKPDGVIYLAHDVRRQSLVRFFPLCEPHYKIGVQKFTMKAKGEALEILLTRLMKG